MHIVDGAVAPHPLVKSPFSHGSSCYPMLAALAAGGLIGIACWLSGTSQNTAQRLPASTPGNPDTERTLGEMPAFLRMGQPAALSQAQAESILAALVHASGSPEPGSAVTGLLDARPARHLQELNQILADWPPGSGAARDPRNLLWQYWIQRCPESARHFADMNPDSRPLFQDAVRTAAAESQEATLTQLTRRSP